MADNGSIKVLGNNVPKPVAIGGVIAVGVVGVYFYRKNKQTQDQAASVAQAGQSGIDPATGYPYGSAEDAAALQTQSDYQLPTSGYGFTGYAGGSGTGNFATGAPGNFNSNAEWAQYVEAYEEGNLGADAPTLGNAIGKYLTGQPLTSDQIGLVQSAIAIGGYPPVSGPNGNPPSYITSTSTVPPTVPPSPPTTPPPVTNPPPPNNNKPPKVQTGTVHSNTTNESAPVRTTDGGYNWTYIGSPPKAGQAKNQVGTVHSDTTNENAKVASYDAGLHWRYTGK